MAYKMKTVYLLIVTILISLSANSQTKKVGVNTPTPTENLDVNGIVRLRAHPADGETNAIYTLPNGEASGTKNQTFNSVANLVADSNGVLGHVITDGLEITSITETFIAPTGGFGTGSANNPSYVVEFGPFSIGFYQNSNNNQLYCTIRSNTTTSANINLREFTTPSRLFPSGDINLTAGIWHNTGWYFKMNVDAWYADIRIVNTNTVYQLTVLGAKWSGTGDNTTAAGDQFTVNILEM